MSKGKRLKAEERRRLRLLYSLGDFQVASSAMVFLGESDPEKKYTKVEHRRFRCYETTVITAYTRPFSLSKGEIPQLTLEMIDLKLDDDEQELHDRLIKLRNKVFAHSDADMMRMTSETFPIRMSDAFVFMGLQTVFDEGLFFADWYEHSDLRDLINTVNAAVYKKLLHEAQEKPEKFNLRKDYLKE